MKSCRSLLVFVQEVQIPAVVCPCLQLVVLQQASSVLLLFEGRSDTIEVLVQGGSTGDWLASWLCSQVFAAKFVHRPLLER